MNASVDIETDIEIDTHEIEYRGYGIQPRKIVTSTGVKVMYRMTVNGEVASGYTTQEFAKQLIDHRVQRDGINAQMALTEAMAEVEALSIARQVAPEAAHARNLRSLRGRGNDINALV